MPQAWPRPARQLGDGVVDTGFRASDDHRAAAVIDDVDCDLSSHAGTAADHNDLLGLKMHVRVRLPGSSLTCFDGGSDQAPGAIAQAATQTQVPSRF